MQDRVRSVGGTMVARNRQAGRGVRVEVTLPLPQKPIARETLDAPSADDQGATQGMDMPA